MIFWTHNILPDFILLRYYENIIFFLTSSYYDILKTWYSSWLYIITIFWKHNILPDFILLRYSENIIFFLTSYYYNILKKSYSSWLHIITIFWKHDILPDFILLRYSENRIFFPHKVQLYERICLINLSLPPSYLP